MDDTRVQLGPFELRERIGAGGMGAVYRARHGETGGSTAIKVLLSKVARRSQRLRDFRREIQALAKLHHPAVAAIVDYGEIDAESAAAGPVTFAEGAPWFAMEYVEGDPLGEVVGGWTWEAVESFLVTTLDALAHAHARSIIHRDLKFSNIMVERATGRIKLVDFGVAGVFDDPTDREREAPDRVVGTPKYMAPEQFLGEWRDQGPWTDLYALGCLTWRIVCGVAPYDGGTTEEVLEAHIREPPPKFDPRFPVPAGLQEWLSSMLHTQVDRRIRRAADAVQQLRKLGEPTAGIGKTGEPDDLVSDSTVREAPPAISETIAEPWAPTEEVSLVDRPAGDGNDDGPGLQTESPDATTGVPADWRRDRKRRTAAVLPKAGLELFGLREIPVVDRETERDRMWAALREIDRTGRARLVTLEAGPGTGKTRLARWLSQRAHEVGAATPLRGVHTEAADPGEGLRGMVRRGFRTSGLARDEVFERLVERLPPLDDGNQQGRPADARALTEFLRPTDPSNDAVTGPRYQFASPTQKYALLGRLLERMATRRPIIVWLDDLQWGRETIAFLEETFGDSAPAQPILFVTTVRSDVLADDPDGRTRYEALTEAADADRMAIAPLDADDHRALIDRLLVLDPDLADELAERTEGHPLFAIQLLRDWVERRMLTVGDRGFRIAEGVSVEVPDDVHRLWLDRLERLVATFPDAHTDEIWRELELAGVLGRELDAGEWEAARREAGLEGTPRLVDRLVQRGLADRTDAGWAFTHGLLVESLERRARQSGRWRDLHRRCARMLEHHYSDAPMRTAARRADHWERAGELERAISAWWEESERLTEFGSMGRALEALERREALLETVGDSETTERWLENAVAMANARLHAGQDPSTIKERIQAIRDRAPDTVDDTLISKCWQLQSRCERIGGDQGEAMTSARKSTEWARRADTDTYVSKALMAWGWISYTTGRGERAKERLAAARDYAEAAGTLHDELESRRMLAFVAMSRGEFAAAKTTFEEVLEEAKRAGYRRSAASCLNGLGEIARFRGDVDRARRHYRGYEDVARELARPGLVGTAVLNQIQVELMDRRFEVALDRLAEAERRLEAIGQRERKRGLIRLERLVAAIGTGDWSSVDRIWDHYADGWPDEDRLERDSPWLVEMAGDYADEAGREDVAGDLWRLSLDLWEQIGDEQAGERLTEKLDG